MKSNKNESNKRIELFFNRLLNIFINFFPLQNFEWLNNLQNKGKLNYYFKNDENISSEINNFEVNWEEISKDIESNLDFIVSEVSYRRRKRD